jgi:two-component system sensor histidine kinase PilS (NtrC family)
MSPSFSKIPLIKKIQGLIFGRLALIFLLFLASWWWTNTYLHLSPDFFPVHLFYLFVFSLFLTALYWLVLYFNDNYWWQIRIQFLIDVLLITSLVWGTGDLISPYVTLYVILISTAGFFLTHRETIFMAFLSAICFTLIPILTSQDFIFSLSNQELPSRSLQVIAFNNVVILIVGLLAARLSERQKISEQLRQTTESFADLHILHERIVESIKSGLITTDLDGNIYNFNSAAKQITGVKVKEMLGKPIFSLFGDEIHAEVDLCLKNAKEAEFFSENFEAVLNLDETSAKTVSCTVVPLVGKNGQVYGLIFTFQDITEIKEMEETIRRSDRLAAVGRMAAGLAHEIRNPLGSMGSALQFLQEKLPPETTEASLMEVVLRESDRLNNIITNFLTYARPSADIFSNGEFTELDLDEIIRDCLALLRHSPEINDRHILNYESPKESPITVKANETQIKQVFWNLAKNAIQAMPNGGKLSIKLKTISPNKIQIVFEDNGKGISPEHLEHIFEPFSANSHGTGLGLSIVHKIVNDHRGKIEVKSEIGKGTKIMIELPVGDTKNGG